MSGLDILEELREQGRGILAIMITAYATFETAVQATKLGAYDFLPKPFSPEELRYAVRKATNQLIISREARRLAEEKRQVRFNFISVLSHELKAPLNAIEGYLKILQTDEPPERLPMIDRSLIRLDGMRKLIFDLLDLTRIESGQKQRELGAGGRARGREGGHRPLHAAKRRRAASASRCGRPSPWRWSADPGELEIILNNLVSNAVKYNRDGGSVTVALEREGRSRQDPGGRHRHRHDPRGDAPSSSRSSCASRTRTRSRSWAAAWASRRCASWPNSTAATPRSRARRARAALHGDPPRRRSGGASPARGRLTPPARTEDIIHSTRRRPAEGPGGPDLPSVVYLVRESCGQDTDRGRRPGHGDAGRYVLEREGHSVTSASNIETA